MIPKYKLFLFSCLIIPLACQPESTSTDGEHFTFDSFPVVDSTLAEAATWEVMGNFFNLYPFDDYVILGRPEGNTAFVVYDKQTGEKVSELLHFGNGPGEVLSSPTNVWQDVQGDFFAHDITTSKIIKLPDLRDGTGVVEEVAMLEEPFRNMYGVAPGHREGSLVGLSATHGDARYYEFGPGQDTLKKIGTLAPPPANWPDEAATPYYNVNARAHQGAFAVHPSQNWVVITEQFRHKIDVYKGDTLFTTLLGPGENEPTVEFVEQGENQYHAYINSNFVYVDVMATEHRFYVVYLNCHIDFLKCENVFAFDWEGNPVAHFKLPYSMLPVVVRETETGLVEFWGQHQENGNIVQLTSTIFQ